MKNLINNDSIHRVEPSARQLSELIHKNEAEQHFSQKSIRKEADQKSQQVNESDAADHQVNADAQNKRDSDESNKRANKKIKSPFSRKPTVKPRFFGGQLLDREG